jgi:hypothetical protein
MRRALAVVGVAALSLAPAWAAGMDTVRIVIKGEQLTAPVEIADPKIVALFHVGAGPGNFRRMADGLNSRPTLRKASLSTGPEASPTLQRGSKSMMSLSSLRERIEAPTLCATD